MAVSSLRSVPIIGLSEILFLMRKDTAKVVRLLKHFALKDSLSSSSSGSAFDTMSNFESSASFDGPDWNNAVQSMSNLMDGNNLIQQQQSSSQQNVSRKKSSRMEVCIKVLKLIDTSNVILDTYNDEDYVDTIKMNRNVVSN